MLLCCATTCGYLGASIIASSFLVQRYHRRLKEGGADSTDSTDSCFIYTYMCVYIYIRKYCLHLLPLGLP